MVYLLTPALPPGLQPAGSTLKVAIEEGEFELGPHFHDPEDSTRATPVASHRYMRPWGLLHRQPGAASVALEWDDPGFPSRLGWNLSSLSGVESIPFPWLLFNYGIFDI